MQKVKSKKKRNTAAIPTESTSTSSKKRACLVNLPGNSKLPPNIAQNLKIPSFIAELEARHWKNEEALVESYFKHTTGANSQPEQFRMVLIGAMNKLVSSAGVDSKFVSYCTALIQQFSGDNSKSRIFKIYRKEKQKKDIEEMEEESGMEAKLTSRVLTTIEAINYKDSVQGRLDALLDESSRSDKSVTSDNVTFNNITFDNNTSERGTQSDLESYEESNELENPFMMAEESPSLQVIKEKNLYKFQAPSNHVISPNKPIIQLTDLSVLKTYFDICIGTLTKEVSDESRLEYERMMTQQKEFFHLKAIPGGVYDTLLQLLQSNQSEMFDNIVNLPKNIPFLEFVKYAMFDFLLNLKRPQTYKNGDERSIYCEIFIPLFKAFGNCTQALSYTWCEKKAKDSDYIWLVSNDFAKERKDNLKLLDGVGRLVTNDVLNYFLIESSGFNGDNVVSHTLNDTLKNIKNGHDSLKFFISNYRSASFNTMKKMHLFSCQIIQNKMTLIKYSIKSPTTWQVVECRSASVPLRFSDALEYIKVFELFAFLQNDILEQEKVLKKLKLENLNIDHVDDQDTVGHCLL